MTASPATRQDRGHGGRPLLLAAIATGLLFAANVAMEILRGDAARDALRDQLEARELALFGLFFLVALRVARRQLARRRAPHPVEGEGEGNGNTAADVRR